MAKVKVPEKGKGSRRNQAAKRRKHNKNKHNGFGGNDVDLRAARVRSERRYEALRSEPSPTRTTPSSEFSFGGSYSRGW